MSPATFRHRPARTWQKLVITVPAHRAETAAAYLATISANGIEQVSLPPAGHSGLREQLIAYLPDDRNLPQTVREIAGHLERSGTGPAGHEAITIRTEQVREEDWNKNWKEHFRPFRMTERLVIKPTWEEYRRQGDELVLEMDPGMAFGTGLHSSTRLALLLTEQIFTASPPLSVLDVGCGTGILGMSCALYGAERVVCLDCDIDARVAAATNAAHNGLSKTVRVDEGALEQINDHFDLVIANITQDVLTSLATDLVRVVAPDGHLVLSGILAGEQAEAINLTFTGLGLHLLCSEEEKGWTALAFSSR